MNARSKNHLGLVACAIAAFLGFAAPTNALQPPLPALFVREGQLKDIEPPAWQMIALLRIDSEADVKRILNPTIDKLFGFLETRGASAHSVVIAIDVPEELHEHVAALMNWLPGYVASKGHADLMRVLKMSTTLTDPKTKKETTILHNASEPVPNNASQPTR